MYLVEQNEHTFTLFNFFVMHYLLPLRTFIPYCCNSMFSISCCYHLKNLSLQHHSNSNSGVWENTGQWKSVFLHVLYSSKSIKNLFNNFHFWLIFSRWTKIICLLGWFSSSLKYLRFFACSLFVGILIVSTLMALILLFRDEPSLFSIQEDMMQVIFVLLWKMTFLCLKP